MVINGARVNVRNTAGQFPVDLARGKPGFEEIQELLGSDSCPICAEPITPDNAFRRGNIIFGCSPKHIIHEACLLNPLTHHPLAACPECRATLDEAAAAAERAALMAHYTATEEHPDIIPVLPGPEIHVIANPWALIFATEHGNLTRVRAQLAAGADVSARSLTGSTALILAASSVYLEIVNALLTHPNIDVNAHDDIGCTALIHAARQGHLGIVNALLGHRDRSGNLDIDVNAHNNENKIAIDYATPDSEIEHALIAHGAHRHGLSDGH